MNLLLKLAILLCIFTACNQSQKPKESDRMKILIDTDANNELDDQHALAYAFLNTGAFNLVGVTVNNTRNGNGIQGQYDEAMRIIQLFNLQEKVPLLKGADKNFSEIFPFLGENDFDGKPAVDFIIREAMKTEKEKLVLIPVGKLTNIALALHKNPEIVDKVKVVWLGSNYPGPGEYNLDNDTIAVNQVIESGVEFEMVTVRYGQPSGTSAVTVTLEEVNAHLKGRGPKSHTVVTGRHGGTFTCFGDYSANLFEHATMHGNPPSRALYDMAAVAVVKNPEWAEKKEIPAPRLEGIKWIEQPDNQRKISIWENFNRDAIVNDLFDLITRSNPK